MAAGPWLAYDNGLLKIVDGTINLLTASTLRMALVTSGYTPNLSHTAWNAVGTDPGASEVAAGGNYSTHGQALANVTVTDQGAGIIQIDCDDVSWASSTITAKYAVIVHDADQNGVLVAADIPLFYCDLNDGGGSVSSTAANFDININANGVYRLTAAQS